MRTRSHGRVLLIEADSAEREATSHALETSGYQLESTGSPAEAVKLATSAPYDVVICDQDMPGIDGLSLLRSLQEREVSAAPVLLCSNRSNRLATEAAEAGVLQVLEKPVDVVLLTRVVAAGVLQKRRVLSVLRTIMRPSHSPRAVPATKAKNKFGDLLDTAMQEGAVVITKHEAPEAVLVSVDRISAALAKHEPNLEALTEEFDALVARMRTPAARTAARGLFSATSKEFGEAAMAAAKARG